MDRWTNIPDKGNGWRVRWADRQRTESKTGMTMVIQAWGEGQLQRQSHLRLRAEWQAEQLTDSKHLESQTDARPYLILYRQGPAFGIDPASQSCVSLKLWLRTHSRLAPSGATGT